MAIVRQLKNLNKRVNSSEILGQYVIPYSIKSNSRYKHIDELDLADGKRIKASMGYIDLGTMIHSGTTDYIITQADTGRLDIVATKVYGYASLWWIIAYANNISDPFSDVFVKDGRILKIPNMDDLRIFPNSLS